MNETLTRIKRFVEGGDGPVVAWSGTYYGVDNKFVKLNSVYLNILDMFEGTARYRRIPGYRAKDKERKLYVLFGDEVVYRITSGNRRGQLVHLSELYSKEQCVPACSIKRLEQGKNADLFNPSRKVDLDIARLIGTADQAVRSACIEETFPSMFLTCRSGTEVLHVRQYGHAMRYLESLPGYNKSLLPDENVKNLLHLIGEDAGNERRAYPFDIFRGRGVLAVSALSDTMTFGQWYKVPRVVGHTPHMEVVA